MFLGALTFFNDAVAATKTTIKDAPTLLHGLKLLNITATSGICYLQFFDALAANVTVGTTPPTFCIRLKGDESLPMHFEKPVQFLKGCTIAACTTATGSAAAACSVLAVYE